MNTWTCTYSDPTHADGTPASTDYTNTFAFTTSTCVGTSTQATSTAMQIVPYGDWVFGTMIIIFFLAFPVATTIFRFIFPTPKI